MLNDKMYVFICGRSMLTGDHLLQQLSAQLQHHQLHQQLFSANQQLQEDMQQSLKQQMQQIQNQQNQRLLEALNQHHHYNQGRTRPQPQICEAAPSSYWDTLQRNLPKLPYDKAVHKIAMRIFPTEWRIEFKSPLLLISNIKLDVKLVNFLFLKNLLVRLDCRIQRLLR